MQYRITETKNEHGPLFNVQYLNEQGWTNAGGPYLNKQTAQMFMEKLITEDSNNTKIHETTSGRANVQHLFD
jgi:hypothetical protein